MADPAPAARAVSELQHRAQLKTLRVHKDLVADTLQKYGIFIMHEMPAGAQLIRALEWEQVGMWQKRGSLQNRITLAKQIYNTDGNTNTRIINILLMQYRHLSVKQSNSCSSIFLFPHWKRHLDILLLAICNMPGFYVVREKANCLQREATPDVGAQSKTWHCFLAVRQLWKFWDGTWPCSRISYAITFRICAIITQT